MNNLKNFLKKKEAQWKFQTGNAGTGRKLSDNISSQPVSASSSSAYVPSERRTGPDRNVAEAALARNQTTGNATGQRSQGQNLGQKATLHDLLNEEKKKLQEEAKIKDQLEKNEQRALIEEQQSKANRVNPMKTFDESQLFYCPILFPNSEASFSIKELTVQMKSHIFDSFSDDSLMRSAMVMFNCNRSPTGSNHILQPCLDVIKKITTNLQNATNEEELKKFSRIRKSKIEKNVLKLDGSLDFLFAIGFTNDPSDNEWICYVDELEQTSSKMLRINELLNEPQIFDIKLDRQVRNISNEMTETVNHDNDDILITSADVRRYQVGLENQRKINDMFVSRSTKDKLISGVEMNDYKPIFTVLKFKMPIADEIEIIQANFKSTEKFGEVKSWFISNFGEFFERKNIKFSFGKEILGEDSDERCLSELKMVPAAALHVIVK